MNTKQGFTLVELLLTLVVVIVIAIMLCIGGAVIMGNQWYKDSGVLRAIQLEYPLVTRVLKSERRAFGYSTVITEDTSGKRQAFELDSNIFFNYKLKPK